MEFLAQSAIFFYQSLELALAIDKVKIFFQDNLPFDGQLKGFIVSLYLPCELNV